MRRGKKITVDYPIFKIVGDGGMSLPEIGEGRFIPALIIDVEDETEIIELIKLHQGSIPGDTDLSWGTPPKSFFKPKSVYLNLEFTKPMKVRFGIEFSIAKHFTLVDGIIQSRCFFLEAGIHGDKVSEFKNDRIMIEVPELDFDDEWDSLLFNHLSKKYRNLGDSKKVAKSMATEQINGMREIWNIRRPYEK